MTEFISGKNISMLAANIVNITVTYMLYKNIVDSAEERRGVIKENA